VTYYNYFSGSGEDDLIAIGENIDLQCYGGDSNDTEIGECEIKPCPGWGEWEEWSTCSLTCAGGVQDRVRVCKEGELEISVENCGSEDELKEIQDCNAHNW
jgi:hypothetical protein